MNLNLAPTYHSKLQNHVVFWHQNSNNYSIVDSDFYILLETYFKADNHLDFINTLKEVFNLSADEAISLEVQITELLEEANTNKRITEKEPIAYHLPSKVVSVTYEAYHQIFEIKADNTKLLHLLHPVLAHLKIETVNTPKAIFYIAEVQGYIHLFLNSLHYGCFLKADYHLLQGRFVMLLLSVLHNKPDDEWLASFHASTVAKNGNAVMLLGSSGKGKSTLSALLAFNGFEFVSDDVSGMLAADNYIYNYPAAISIKSGAFNTLNQAIPKFEHLPTKTKFNKGNVKYLAITQPNATKYTCNTVIMVHYNTHPTIARLEKIPTSKALETLIPDTWISPKPQHAKAFLEWLPSIKAYELHYHNNKEAIQIIETLLKS